mgnify:CR=1 FL=1
MKNRILVVDDDQDTCDLMEASLSRQGFDVTTRTSALSALAEIATRTFDVVLTDLGMGEMDGLALIERIIGTTPDVPVIVVTGQSTMGAAISALQAGAYDFLTKPIDNKLLLLALGRATRHHSLVQEVKQLREAVASPSTSLVGESEAMKRVLDLVSRVSTSNASVLVVGETGTGKELIARAIHANSPRHAAPFVAINCAAVPAALLESELFGHAKGAFTDARTDRKGLFLQADGGTLFLDEIGDMAVEMQAKLLRALQERTVRPVGSNSELAFDARILAATNRDLETEVFEKRFREDLYYRLNVVTIALPPLRARGMDVIKLASHFLQKHAPKDKVFSLSAAIAERLTAYQWPGNVRELENCMERAVALARFDEVTVEDLPQKIRAYRPEHFVVSADDPREIITLDELERRYIERVLKLLDGNKSRAAQVLALDRRTLYRKLERYEKSSQASEPS